MGDSTSNRATLRNKFELEKFRSKVIKSQPETESSPSNSNQKKKASEIEEIVKHMKRLPNYLEKGKPIPDRALSFGVMDWALLEKWQHRNHKRGFIINRDQIRSQHQQQTIPNPVTGRVWGRWDADNHTSIRDQSCTQQLQQQTIPDPDTGRAWGRWDADSHTSTRDQSCSPSSQKVHRVTLQSHFQDIKPVVLETNGNDSSKNNHAASKSRNMSPLRRFSFSQSPKSKSPVSQKSTTDSNRGHTSPLRRLFDPIFPSKSHQSGETCNENSKNFKNSKEIRVDDDFKFSSFWKQALFQTTVKYDRLLFTFAVENNKDILAATVTSLHSIKDNDIDNICLLYTFFTVQEVKKKTINWLSHGTETDKDHGYVPNVTAQMKVSNSDYGTRDFVLFSVNSNVQQQEELEAIVVKSSRNVNNGNDDDDEERFETNVILPGGVHGVPMKGEPSPLIGRWRSGGVCDCGGWDVGCRLKTLTNQTSDKTRVNSRHELFFQGEVKNKRPIFSLSALKDGIFSVDFNSSLSPLQAFSICISVVESRKTTQKTQLRKHIHEEAPVIYTRIPRIKKTTTGTVGFM